MLRGSAWMAAGYGARQVLTFASMLVLARLVDPEAFGLIALTSPFLLALQYLQESGLSAAVVHRRQDHERAAATVVVAAPVTGLLLYVAVFLVSPLIAHAFHAAELSLVLRIVGLGAVLRSVAIAPSALLERSMNFRGRAQVDLAAATTQFAVAIPLAVGGAGVWALVGGLLAAQVVESALYWRLTPVRPSPRDASWQMFRELTRYSRFVGANNILNLFNSTIDNLVVGRLLGATRLAYYALSYRLALLPNSVIGYVVGRVMFSVYASLQHDRASVKRIYLENLQRIAVFALPVAVALVLAADPIVPALLGNRWSPAIGPLRLLGVYALVRSFLAPSNELFKGLGHPKYGLIGEIGFGVLVLPALVVFVRRFGATGAPLALLIGLGVIGIPMFVVALRLVDVSARELATSLWRPIAAAGVVAVCLFAAVRMSRDLQPLVSFAIVSAVGVAAYVVGTALFARRIVRTMWANARTA